MIHSRSALARTVNAICIRASYAANRALFTSKNPSFTVVHSQSANLFLQIPLLRRHFATQNRFKNDKNQKRVSKEEELSELIVNVSTGEKMPLLEYTSLAKKQVLRISVDGTKTEMSLQDAVNEACELDLDAVLVSRETEQLVVKVLDHAKVRHDLAKKQKDSAKKCANTSIKELRLGLNIGQHDLDIKLKQAKEFLEKGHKVKLFIKLRGAAFYNSQQESCEKIDEIAKALSSHATKDKGASLLGNVASVTMVPLPKKVKGVTDSTTKSKDGQAAAKPADKSAPSDSVNKSKDAQATTKPAGKGSATTIKQPNPQPVSKVSEAGPQKDKKAESGSQAQASSGRPPLTEETIIVRGAVNQVKRAI